MDIGSAYLGQGQPEQALEWYRRGQSFEFSVRSYDAHIVRALASMGELEEAQLILQRLQEQSEEQYIRAEILAMGYAALGKNDQAFECLETALAARSGGLIYVHLDPGYQPLRDDPRFATFVEKVGVK